MEYCEETRPLPRRVLLIADAPEDRFLILQYVAGTEFVLDCAQDKQTALDVFQLGKYDLVLMDLEVPAIDGCGASRKIREREAEIALQRTPILYLTKPILIATLLLRMAELTGDPNGNRRIVAHPPSMVRDAIPWFLERRRQELEILKDALDYGDFAIGRSIGHDLKASGSGFGFPALSVVGRALEHACKLQDVHAACRQLIEYEDILKRTEVNFEG